MPRPCLAPPVGRRAAARSAVASRSQEAAGLIIPAPSIEAASLRREPGFVLARGGCRRAIGPSLGLESGSGGALGGTNRSLLAEPANVAGRKTNARTPRSNAQGRPPNGASACTTLRRERPRRLTMLEVPTSEDLRRCSRCATGRRLRARTPPSW